MSRRRVLSLTPAHIARVYRAVEDAGAPPGQRMDDDDYAGWVARILATNPTPESPTRVFAYGSLIWKPEIAHVGDQPGRLRGWHRAFCLRQVRFRGTPDAPGLMMTLDRGGQCREIGRAHV